MLQEIHKGVFCNPHEVEYVKLQPNLDTLVKLKHGAEIIICLLYTSPSPRDS